MFFHVILSHSSADIILISAKIIYKYSTNNRKNDKRSRITGYTVSSEP